MGTPTGDAGFSNDATEGLGEIVIDVRLPGGARDIRVPHGRDGGTVTWHATLAWGRPGMETAAHGGGERRSSGIPTRSRGATVPGSRVVRLDQIPLAGGMRAGLLDTCVLFCLILLILSA